MKEKNSHISATIIMEAPNAAMNNAGTDTKGAYGNTVLTKKIRSKEGLRPYRSGQSMRYMLRTNSQQEFGWIPSPIRKVEKKNQALTKADPLTYFDDDAFGYMSAQKIPTGKKDKKGNQKMKEHTFTRISPFKCGDAIGLPISPEIEQCSLRRGFEGDTVLYAREQYNNYLKWPINVDVSNLGTFTAINMPGAMNISEQKGDELEKKGMKIGEKTYRVDKKTRQERTRFLIEPLKSLYGGAVQASKLSDSTPRMIAIVALDNGNTITQKIFPHRSPKDPLICSDAILQVCEDHGKSFQSKLYIGIQPGFAQGEEKEVETLKHDQLVVARSPEQAITLFLEEITKNDDFWK